MAVLRISGYPGSGKTTLSKRLAQFLGYEYYYTGGIFRAMAEEKRLSIEEFYKQIASDPELEKSVDSKQEDIMKAKDNLVVEGRIAPFQASPFQTINILLTVDLREGARRELLREENKERSLEEMIALTRERVKNEEDHYFSLYGIKNHLGKEHFDMVIDTTALSPDAVFETASRRVTQMLAQH